MRQGTVRQAGELFSWSCWCSCSLKGCHVYLVLLLCVLFSVVLSLPCASNNHLISHAKGMKSVLDDNACVFCSGSDESLLDLLVGDVRSTYAQENLRVTPIHGSSCTESDFMCFPSMLHDFVAEKKPCRAASPEVVSKELDGTLCHHIGDVNSTRSMENMLFKLLNGMVVSCFLYSDRDFGRNSPFQVDNVDLAGFPHGYSDPNVALKKSSTLNLDSYGIKGGSSSPHVVISPPSLDWGCKYLFSPSVEFLNVTNTCNDSILHIYRPFSSDLQFYAYNFDDTLVAPGDTVSISVVFFPKFLGSSSAHLVLETSSGGFIVHVRGEGVESPYGIQPLVWHDVISDGSLLKNITIYNPSDDILRVEEITASISVSSSDNGEDSVHAVCRRDLRHELDDQLHPVPNSKERLNFKTGQLGLPSLGLRPYKQWEVDPHSSETIMEIDIFSHMEGKISGFFCIRLWNAFENSIDTVMVPLEAEIFGIEAYGASEVFFSIFLESLTSCDGKEFFVIALSLRDGASNLLRLCEIIEVTEGTKVFHVQYVHGLILLPGTTTRMAVVTLNPVPSQDPEPRPPTLSPDCKLVIVTNDSVNPRIEIPCPDFFQIHQEHHRGPVFYNSYQVMDVQSKKAESGTLRLGLSRSVSKSYASKAEVAEADELILRNWRSQSTSRNISVLDSLELPFPIVPVGKKCSKWINVRNPSKKPVVMQLILNSAVIVDQCKGGSDEPINIWAQTSINTFSMEENAITEAYVHPNSTASFGPIFFHPTDRCLWRSSALIRNNLSGVEWLSLWGFGGLVSLILLEESEPVESLDFKMNMPQTLNVTPQELLVHMEGTRAACIHPISKELYAKNAGDLPLEVERIEVSGTTCGSDGFTVHGCSGFSLNPGESTRLLISYQTDFSAPVVHRNLELSLSSMGILVFPMEASLPAYMLSLCKKSFFWMMVRKASVVVLAAASITFLVFSRFFLPQMTASNTHTHLPKSNKSSIATSTRSLKIRSQHQNHISPRSVSKHGYLDALGHSLRHPSDVAETVTAASQHTNWGPSNQNRVSACLDEREGSPLSLKGRDTMEESASAPCQTHQQNSTSNLTVRVEKLKGKRRTRRGIGAKRDISSSQSGNSTPSSPVSPLTPLVTSRPNSPLVKGFPTRTSTSISSEASPAVVDICSKPETHNFVNRSYDDSYPSTSSSSLEQLKEKSFVHRPRSGGSRPVLMPSATFPSMGWRESSLPVRASSSISAIAPPPYPRAPGSRIGAPNIVEEGHPDNFTYDIWGNHFSELRLMDQGRACFPGVLGDSQSFFARTPHAQVEKGPLARAGSPAPPK
ncbi:uncharacterized protein LOC18425368 [Amborella trichopoda]|uniref:uncharacterized protein LOC18425368 n=1 Tax=Amborella trichopoda TaxID=13333 RepID=UPI0009BCB27E|nr:uncharacterized protein LOC18425368 [Amborella trichopoda]XP_020517647.1 uncharacterized protein LOC18425368 [Amborella trichopoda]XP_020517648.1 uncharacterized protein LOC18425368 [Amborella trichopoda]XP_020517649.1 uncharacterized protein LOC18425368 [Amborella trichopoda]|eukprot:XP_011629323.2 uncharacterized protein LOC18425368 [Amborella trichopoda]